MTSGQPKDEYLDLSANLRHYMSLRFAQLTVYLTITGVLLNLLFTRREEMGALLPIALKSGGLLVTILFWIHQERTTAYWNHFMRRAVELEQGLGYAQYSARPPAGWLSSFKAMRALFLFMALFWGASFVWW